MLSIFSKQNAEHKRLVKTLKGRPLDPAELAELNDLLRTDHGTVDEGLLSEVLDISEKLLLESHDEKLHALLTEIHRSANWEIQSRYRAT
jgi:hypothetical protein